MVKSLLIEQRRNLAASAGGILIRQQDLKNNLLRWKEIHFLFGVAFANVSVTPSCTSQYQRFRRAHYRKVLRRVKNVSTFALIS